MNARERRRRTWSACGAALVLAVAPTTAAGQGSVGVYSDAQGAVCSLADPSGSPLHGTGFIDAYVVVRPGPGGVRGVEFAAPQPACFTATFIGDQTLPGTLVAGNSQTGVSVALPGCLLTPTHVLTIRYFGNGTTPPCCAYPVVASQSTGRVDVIDCSFTATPGVGVVSTINADASCACAGNSAPWPPHSPQPEDGDPSAPARPVLAWGAYDFDENLAGFDVYLGTGPAPPLVAAGLVSTAYDAGTLLPFTQYYWRVVARDVPGLEASSPLWTFATRAINTPPLAPSVPIPADGALDQRVDDILAWRCSDIDGDAIVYDIYFGTSSPPPLVAADDSAGAFAPGTLAFSTVYYWRVVARDEFGAESSGDEWSFTTRPANFPPVVPAQPSPWNGATDRPRLLTLQWWCSDADGHALSYDVHFGTETPPPLLTVDWPTRSYQPDTLQFSTQYYWQVVARDEIGAETPGPTWHFTTKGNSPPQTPSAPVPAHNSANRPVDQKLGWNSSDVDMQAITYDVHLGTVTPPPLVASEQPSKQFDPGALAFSTPYFWKIVARDELGAESQGPIWKFTTAPISPPPNPPSQPGPANNAINRPLVQTLTWQCTDPDGDPITYDVYFGTASPPPLLVNDVPVKSHRPDTLQFVTTYHWRIVARDVWGVESTGPEWTFTTRPENLPPNLPSQPSPQNNATNVSVLTSLSWFCSDQDGDALTYDVFFGTEPTPPLLASGLALRTYQPDTLAVGTRYYWRIVARDEKGAEGPGPVWSFATRPDQPPTVPASPSPPHNALASTTPTLTWVSTDLEGKGVTFDLFFGPTDAPPPLVATGLVTPAYVPGPLPVATRYQWLVIASDGSLRTVGPMWTFTTAIAGDADQSGTVTLADASCALGHFVQQSDCGTGTVLLADVDCSGEVTPGDALCIHRHVLDTSCAFCDPLSSLARDAASVPVVSAGALWQEGDTLTIALKVAGVPALHAWGLRVEFAQNMHLLDLTPGVASSEYTDFASSVFSGAGLAGGYALDGVPAALELLRMRLRIPAGSHAVYVDGFTDDLAGASRLSIVWNGSPSGVGDTPAALTLGQNVPNPFNPTTTIPYTLPEGMARVRLFVMDASGRVVRRLLDEEQGGGPHEVVWDGRDDRGGPVASGVYFSVLDADGERRARKLVLLK